MEEMECPQANHTQNGPVFKHYSAMMSSRYNYFAPKGYAKRKKIATERTPFNGAKVPSANGPGAAPERGYAEGT